MEGVIENMIGIAKPGNEDSEKEMLKKKIEELKGILKNQEQLIKEHLETIKKLQTQSPLPQPLPP